MSEFGFEFESVRVGLGVGFQVGFRVKVNSNFAQFLSMCKSVQWTLGQNPAGAMSYSCICNQLCRCYVPLKRLKEDNVDEKMWLECSML